MASPLATIFIILAFISPSLAEVVVDTNAFKFKELSVDFYKTSCPNVEKIVSDVTAQQIKNNSDWLPGVIRLHFHDCFITGCDASILLAVERYNQFAAELAHPLNGASMRGMQMIDAIKTEVEKQCPGVVSCADILAYATRDAIVMVGNPHYTIPAGRRDGSNVDGSLPHFLPTGSQQLRVLVEKFATRGLTLEDLVTLEGAHSIGQSICQDSIASPDGVTNVTMFGDKTVIDKAFQASLSQRYCPVSSKESWPRTALPMNPGKMNSDWGVSFYKNILNGKAVLPIDSVLAAHPSTKDLVTKYANDPALWAKKFNEAMIKMGTLNVLTGQQGEIRKQCTVPNNVELPVTPSKN